MRIVPGVRFYFIHIYTKTKKREMYINSFCAGELYGQRDILCEVIVHVESDNYLKYVDQRFN